MKNILYRNAQVFHRFQKKQNRYNTARIHPNTSQLQCHKLVSSEFVSLNHFEKTNQYYEVMMRESTKSSASRDDC